MITKRQFDCDVVIPFHDRCDQVMEAVRSILAQRDAHCALHIVNDASTRPLSSELQEMAQHPQVFWITNRTNIGPYRSVHCAFPHMQSPFLAIQDADDISAPDRVAVSVAALRDDKSDFFASAASLFGESARVEGPIIISVPPNGCDRPMIHGTMVMRRASFQSLNGYADFFCGADNELVHRAFYSGARFSISDKVLVAVRRQAGSLTRAPATGFRWAAEGTAMEWVSPYRQAVWQEIDRRLAVYRNGCNSFAEFGCLDPQFSRTLHCVPEALRYAAGE